VLRTLSLCTCRRHYPGAASERIVTLGAEAYQVLRHAEGLFNKRDRLISQIHADDHRIIEFGQKLQIGPQCRTGRMPSRARSGKIAVYKAVCNLRT
jgi:hypothetical protein